MLKRLDPEVKFEQLLEDGARIKPGDIAFYVEGRLISLLQAERILLNIMQRMSGVATQTAIYVKELEGLKTKVLDTRKTTPGMRVLDKMAVKLGEERITVLDFSIWSFSKIIISILPVEFSRQSPCARISKREREKYSYRGGGAFTG